MTTSKKPAATARPLRKPPVFTERPGDREALLAKAKLTAHDRLVAALVRAEQYWTLLESLRHLNEQERGLLLDARGLLLDARAALRGVSDALTWLAGVGKLKADAAKAVAQLDKAEAGRAQAEAALRRGIDRVRRRTVRP